MQKPQHNPELLLEDVPYDRVTKWTSNSFGVARDEFAELVQHLIELDEASAVDIVSMSRDLVAGSRQVCAISFVRLRTHE